MKKRYVPLVSILLLLTTFPVLHAQKAWDLIIHRTYNDYVTGMISMPNGDIVVTGTSGPMGTSIFSQPFLTRLNIYGDTLWVKQNFIPGLNGSFNDVKADGQGNIIAAGMGYSPRRAIVTKLDPSGNVIWLNNSIPNVEIVDMDFYSNGDLLVAGNYHISGSSYDNWWARVSHVTGDTIWTYRRTPGVAEEEIRGMEAIGNDEFMMARQQQGTNMDLVKINANGNILLDTAIYYRGIWSVMYNNSFMKRLSDGTIIIAGKTAPNLNQASFARFNTLGDSLPMNHQYNPLPAENIQSITETHDGHLLAVIIMNYLNQDEYRLNKYTLDGQLIWSRAYHPGYAYSGPRTHIIMTQDSGFLAGTSVESQIAQGRDYWLLKVDTAGYRYSNTITGKVYVDANSNCQYDPGELPLANRQIMILPDSIAAFTDSLGNYTIYADSGAFTVVPAFNHFSHQFVCPNPLQYSVNFTANNYQSSTGNDFAIRNDTCSNLWVDIASPILRLCLPGYYEVEVCNYGLQPKNNVQVTVQMDSLISTIDQVSIPATVNGQTVTAVINTLQPNECRTFRIHVTPVCDINLLGRTSCAKASVLPHNNCWIQPLGWDHSIIEVEGECIGNDTVQFRIHNNGTPGTGDMQSSRNFTIYEDNILMATQNFQLNGGGTTIINHHVNNGTTITLRAQQHPAYPFGHWASDAVEACGNPQYSLRWINTFGPDDHNPDFEIDCNELVAAYDPNDKQASPSGYTIDGFIDSTMMELQYKIRFQNTGTDTAFNIYIVDTLPGYTDPATFMAGNASHPYTMSWIEPGVIKFMFANIMLPDSNVNEPASNGFVQYRIRLKSGLQEGAKIRNRANIFFDYNPAVITNYAVNTISNDVLVYVGFDNPPSSQSHLTVYPNPFSDHIRLRTENLENPQLQLEVTDITGKIVFTSGTIYQAESLISLPVLSPGVYIYRVYQGTQPLSSGKLVKQ